MFKKNLVRSSLLHEILTYRKSNIYEKDNIKYFKKYLKIIHKAFKASKFKKDESFLLKGTRMNNIDNFYNTLDNKDNFNTLNSIDDPLYYALENLEKLLLGTNNITAKDVDKSKWTKNDEAGRKFEAENNFVRSESVKNHLDYKGFKDWNELLVFKSENPDANILQNNSETKEVKNIKTMFSARGGR